MYMCVYIGIFVRMLSRGERRNERPSAFTPSPAARHHRQPLTVAESFPSIYGLYNIIYIYKTFLSAPDDNAWRCDTVSIYLYIRIRRSIYIYVHKIYYYMTDNRAFVRCVRWYISIRTKLWKPTLAPSRFRVRSSRYFHGWSAVSYNIYIYI